jgi:hypothetical protein
VVPLSSTRSRGRGALGARPSPLDLQFLERMLSPSLFYLCLATGSAPSCPGGVCTVWRTIWTWGEAGDSLNYYRSLPTLGELGYLRIPILLNTLTIHINALRHNNISSDNTLILTKIAGEYCMNSVTVQNRTHVYMNFFDHKGLGNHLLQLCPKVVKHPVCHGIYVPSMGVKLTFVSPQNCDKQCYQ